MVPNIVMKEAAQSVRSFGNECLSNSELYASKLPQNKRIPAMHSGLILDRLAIDSLKYPIHQMIYLRMEKISE